MYSKPFNGNFPITSSFGMRGGKLHSGIDWGTPQGTPLLAIMSGTVTVSQIDQFGAGWVDIRLDNGYLARYLHLNWRDVSKGQRVEKGQKIGLSGGQVGTVGAGQSTGPHLHLAISKNGNPTGFYNYQDIISQWNNPPMPTVTRFSNSDIPKRAGNQALTLFQIQSQNAKTIKDYMTLETKVRQVIDNEFDISVHYLCERLIERDKIIADLKKQLENLKK
jgi:hypothetical protein